MRLIDADALPIKFDGHIVAVWKNDIDNAPTINAVEVVRCKDCILDREAQCPMKYATEPDDFCSWGERIDEVNK